MIAVPAVTQELIEQQAITSSSQTMNQNITWEKVLAAAVVGALISVTALYINSYIPKLLEKK